MYTDAGHVIDTLMHILNNEQEFFRDYIRQYDQEAAEREMPLAVAKGIFDNRPLSVYPMLELEPDSEDSEWATTQAQRPQFDVTIRLSVANANRDLAVEYMTGLVRRVKIILNDPRRLQSSVIDVYGRQQMKYNFDGSLLAINFLDSMITRIGYKTASGGTIRQAEMSWFCKIHEPIPSSYFLDHWPHPTDPTKTGNYGPGKL